MQMQHYELDDGVLMVVLDGRLDLAGVHEIEADFQRHITVRRLPTVVDLSQVAFISSLGIGLIVTCAKSLERHGQKLILLSPQPLVEEALKTTRIDQFVPIAGDRETAVTMAQPA